MRRKAWMQGRVQAPFEKSNGPHSALAEAQRADENPFRHEARNNLQPG